MNKNPNGRDPLLANVRSVLTPDQSSTPRQHSAAGLASYTIWLALAAALGLTFWLYATPNLMVMLAEQLWACF